MKIHHKRKTKIFGKNVSNTIKGVNLDSENTIQVKHSTNISIYDSQSLEKSTLEQTELDLTFPKFKFSKDDLYMSPGENRLVDFSYSIFLFYFVTSLKYFLVEEFEIASFCDLQKWEAFDQSVSQNQTIMIQRLSCTEKCSKISNIILTKVFESNYYFFYCVNVFFFMYFILQQKVKGKLLAFFTFCPFPCHIIGHIAFFWNKSYAFMIGNVLTVLQTFIVWRKSLIYLKMFAGFLLLLFYFSMVKAFFEIVFPYLVRVNPQQTLASVPFLLFLIKLLGKVIFKYPYFRRYNHNIIGIMFIFFIFFEYVYIGTLHTLINKYGFTSYSFWLNLLQNFAMEFFGKTNLLTKIFEMIKAWLKRKVKKARAMKFNEDDHFVKIYYGIKTELEIYSIFIYFLLLSTHYYDYCMTTLVDCIGHPLVNITEISQSHFLLVIVLFLEVGLDNLIIMAAEKSKLMGKIMIKRVNVRFDTLNERFFYIFMLFGLTIDFGFPGLYSMMSI